MIPFRTALFGAILRMLIGVVLMALGVYGVAKVDGWRRGLAVLLVVIGAALLLETTQPVMSFFAFTDEVVH